MEQSRVLLAIALSFLVFFLWSVFFAKTPVPPPPSEQSTQENPAETIPYNQPETTTPSTESIIQPSVASIPPMPVDRTARQLEINTPLYRIEISEQGAVFTSYVLKDYTETIDADSPLKELIQQDNGNGMLQLLSGNPLLGGLEQGIFVADTDESTISVSDTERSIAFQWISSQGIVVEKQFTFFPNSYLIDLDLTIINQSDQVFQEEVALDLTNKRDANQKSFGFQGPSALIDGKITQIKEKKIKEKDTYAGMIKWISIQDQYFISSLILDTATDAKMKISLVDDIWHSQMVFPAAVVSPGTQRTYENKLFIGPKSIRILKQIDGELDKAVDFGWFKFIAIPCLYIMNFVYGFIPNYGIAIIILTIMTKLLLWPLGNKSYKSMNDMKKIQPLMADLRERYKDDKKRMNQELMGLYKAYKINPMGGCLPMVLQIPVFFALYRMLYQAIELRHAPFMLWINDLSAPDRLFSFDFSIPFMQAPYGIPVLTIIMGASMLLQQKMSPPPGDPAQAKMMMIMPVVFTFIFINFSSGLVLYWLVSNLFSMAQQFYIQKKYA
ncbi:MAG: membrane protein insertase YidC [Desulfobacteraceae bacterium]|nr:membrane protein insertase YidC [Desulfobacteraceae bacterium]